MKRRVVSLLPPLLLLLSILIPSTLQLSAQSSILIFPPDVSDFPVVSTSFYPFDRDGAPVDSVTEDMVSLFEDGEEIVPTFFNCPERIEPSPASVVLALDVSGSMGFHVGNDINSEIILDLVIDAAKTFIRGLDLSTSEVSITSFNTRSRVVAPFTRDSTFLFERLDQLLPGEGTDYREAFVGAAGAISAVRGGTLRRVVVMFTDGEGLNGDRQEIIAEARAAGATVYLVVVGPYPLEMLEEIATETGGIYYNLYHQYEELGRLARMLSGHAQLEIPCRIEWLGRPGCERGRRLLLRIPSHGIWGETNYLTPQVPLPELNVEPGRLRFDLRSPGNDTTVPVRIDALNGPVSILGIVSDNGDFSLEDSAGDPVQTPQAIAQGDRLDLVLRYSGSSASYVDTRIIVTTDACIPDTIYVTAGSPVDRGPLPEISILSPNGGERYPVGSEGAISFSGGDRDLPYRLSLSTDGGAGWTDLGSIGNPDRLDLTFPAEPSDSCLARVSQSMTVDESIVVPVGGDVFDMEFSTDGRELLVLVAEGRVLRFDVATGALLGEYTLGVPAVRFRQIHGLSAVVAEYRGSLYVAWADRSRPTDIHSGRVIPVPGSSVDPSWGDRDRRIAAHPSRPILYGVRFVREEAGAVVPVLYRRSVEINDYLAIDTLTCIPRAVAYSANGPMLAVGGVDGCYQIRMGEEEVLHEGTDPYGDIVSMSFDSSGTWILSLSHDPVRGAYSVVVRHSRSGEIVASYPDIAAEVASLGFFGHDGSFLLGERWPTIRSTSSGEISRRFDRVEPGAGGAAADRDGRRIAISTANREVQIWHLDQPFDLVDLSDSLWSLIPSGLSLVDVDFGAQLVGEQVDSTVDRLLSNVGQFPITIDSLRVGGPEGQDFTLLSDLSGVVIEPGESIALELRFRPGGAGGRVGLLNAYSHGVAHPASLTGVGILSGLQIVGLDANTLDFGSHPIGTSIDSTLSVRNRGNLALRIDSIELVGPNKGDFGVDLTELPVTIRPGEIHRFDVRFAPLKEGIRYTAGEIRFADAATSAVSNGSPLRFHLWGKGLPEGANPGGLSDTLLVAESECLAVDTVSTTYINSGSGPIILTSPGFSPGIPVRFIPGSLPATVDAGEDYELRILFEPSTEGTWEESVQLIANGATRDTSILNVDARSVSSPVEIRANAIINGEFCDGSTLELALELLLETEGLTELNVDVLLEGGRGVVISGAPARIELEGGTSETLLIGLDPTDRIDTLRGEIVISGIACTDPIKIPFESVRRNRQMEIVPLDTICSGESLILEVTGEGGVRWEDHIDIGCPDCPRQEITPSSPGWYRVELVDDLGCRYLDSVQVVFRESLSGELSFPGQLRVGINDTISVPLFFNLSEGSLEGLTTIRVRFEYDPSVLLPLIDLEEIFSGTLFERWSVERIEQEVGAIEWYLRGPALAIDQDVTIMRFIARSFLGGVSETRIDGSISFDRSCVRLLPATGSISLDSICGLDDRLFDVANGRWGRPEVDPNPVRSGRVAVRFGIPFDANIRIEAIDITGRLVESLHQGYLPEGDYELIWEVDRLGSGLYFLRMEGGGETFLTPVRLID